MSSKYKRKGGGKFVKLDGYLLRSAAWRSLKPVERAAYLEMLWAFDGFNNGRIGMSARTMARLLNVSKFTAWRALGVLQERGFLDLAKSSGFNVKTRVAPEWRLTEHHVDGRAGSATKDFVKWRPEKSVNNGTSNETVKPTENANNGFTSDHHGTSNETVKAKTTVH